MDEPARSGALSFGQVADRYDRVRPSYPPEAIAWALRHAGGPGPDDSQAPGPDGGRAAGHGEGPLRVVDLGAGTGKMSRVLLALGHDVFAVEPDEQMRARLAATTPAAVTSDGSAERIPIPAASVDAVVAAQAYHWFVPERAHPEIARVLRPGGVFAAIWNMRDESVPWVARLTEILGDRGAANHVRSLDPDVGRWFGPVTRRTFRYEVEMAADRLGELVRTRSYYLTATPARKRELDTAVAELAAELPAPVSMPYETFVYVTRRHPSHPPSPRAADGS